MTTSQSVPIEEAPDERITPEIIDAALHGRRSVRAYRPDPVPESDLQAILDAARWAPSPHNAEPWRFAVLRDAEPKERLTVAMAQRWVEDLTRDAAPQTFIERELAESRRRITEAPVVIVVSLVGEGLDQYPDPKRQQAEQLMAAHSVG